MSKLLTAIKTVVQGEPLTSTSRLNLAMVEQDAALAGNEIDAAHRVLLLVSKARRDANIVGKDLVSDETLLAVVDRARQHQATATQRLEKAAADFARIATLVNGFDAVAHNYRREHRLNMWFVVAAETREAAFDALARIEAATGLKVHAFPKEREYFVGLKLPAAAEAGHGLV